MEQETQASAYREKKLPTAYEPYRREAKYCLIVDIIVSLLVALLLITTGLLILLPLIPLFALAEYLLNYRLVRLARRELREELFTTETVEITAIRDERSAAGHWGSIMHELYPKEVHMGRCKLLCRTEDGQKLTLRGIMSGQKQQMLHDGIDRKQLTRCTLTYGTKTHIVLDFGSNNKLCDELNHKF